IHDVDGADDKVEGYRVDQRVQCFHPFRSVFELDPEEDAEFLALGLYSLDLVFELLEPLSRLDQIERPFAAFAERFRVVREANLVETKL
ncbi:MAG: hypothetical protein V3T08_07730, partial [Gemmatimonadota bacterium]